MSRQFLVRINRALSTDKSPATDWRHRAACRDEDPDLFFPEGSTGPALLQIEEAKSVCRRRCPVSAECLQWALETDQKAGVWGGTSEAERRAMKRRSTRNRSNSGEEATA
ncbi:WhiB family transcriptional regulator [Streptomyces roseolus]|uniref:WhiB family transcriptional regulator n=1 Tax=Streptomyces roseolus TaxID=67358 RepID=UPI0036315D40